MFISIRKEYLKPYDSMKIICIRLEYLKAKKSQETTT